MGGLYIYFVGEGGWVEVDERGSEHSRDTHT